MQKLQMYAADEGVGGDYLCKQVLKRLWAVFTNVLRHPCGYVTGVCFFADEKFVCNVLPTTGPPPPEGEGEGGKRPQSKAKWVWGSLHYMMVINLTPFLAQASFSESGQTVRTVSPMWERRNKNIVSRD